MNNIDRLTTLIATDPAAAALAVRDILDALTPNGTTNEHNGTHGTHHHYVTADKDLDELIDDAIWYANHRAARQSA